MSTFKITISIFLVSISCKLVAEETVCTSGYDCYFNSEPIIVSATRWETSGIPTANNISVITQDQIKTSGADRIIDVLKNQPGIQVRDLYGDGSRASVDMRGFGESAAANTLILVDGRRLNTTDSNGANLQLISLKDVERIEITRGSATVLYGDQAVGGVVNIITREPKKLTGNFELSYGSYDYQTQIAQVSHRLENGLAGRLSVERRKTDNFRDNNDLDYLNAYARFSYDWASGHIFADLQRNEEEVGIPGALFANQLVTSRKQSVNPLDFNDTSSDSYRTGLGYDINNNWSLAGEFTYRNDDVTGGLTIFGTFFPLAQKRLHKSWNPRIRGSIPLGNRTMTLITGVDIEDTDYSLVSPLGIQDTTQTMQSIYALTTLPLNDQFSLTGGVRHAWLENDITDTFRFPTGANLKDEQTATTIGISYNPFSSLRFYLKREENYRFPLVDEETNFFSAQNTLLTQTGVSYEAGIEWHNNFFSTSLSGYILDLDNELVFDPITFQNLNLDQTRRDGIIYSFTFRPTDNLSLNTNYSYTNARFDSGLFNGNRIPLVAEHLFQAGLNWDFHPNWNIYAELFVITDRLAGSDFGDSFSHLPGYGIGNLNLRYHNQGFTISAGVNNIMDKEYSDNASVGFTPAFTQETAYYPAPERNFIITLGYEFD